jgi:hypothetical protein
MVREEFPFVKTQDVLKQETLNIQIQIMPSKKVTVYRLTFLYIKTVVFISLEERRQISCTEDRV